MSPETLLLVSGFQTREILFGSRHRLYNQDFLETPIPWEPSMENDFDQLPGWLKSDGFGDIRITGVPCNQNQAPGIEECALSVRTQILSVLKETRDRREIAVISHSIGGLIIRAYTESKLYAEDVAAVGYNFIKTVFTLGTPHQGSNFSRFLRLSLNSQSHPIITEFPNQEYMRKFNALYPIRSGISYYAIGGQQYGGNLGRILGTYTYINSGPNDGAVPIKSSTNLPGATQSAVVDETHLKAVGIPSYMTSEESQRFSQTYNRCIRPVLAGHDEYGCYTSTQEPRRPKAQEVPQTLLVFGLLYTLASAKALQRNIAQKPIF